MKRLPLIVSWILLYLFITSLLTANCFSYLDPDFGWHLRVGEQISIQKTIPHDQVYMWTLDNENWVDHEWLSNLLIYQLWQLGGYLIVAAFFIILSLLTIIILNRYVFKYYLRKNTERFIFAGLEIFALIGCLPHFGVRIQEFTFLGVILLFIIIDSIRRSRNIKPAYWLIPLLFIWACLHGSFLFGVAVSIGWLVYETGLLFFPKITKTLNEQALSKKQWQKIMALGVLAIVFTFITPYGSGLYAFLSDYGQNRYYLSRIEEWRPPFSSPFRYDQIAYGIFIVTLGLGLLINTKRKLPLWQLTLLVLLFLLASRSIRHFPLFAAASLLFLAPPAIHEALKNIIIPKPKLLLLIASLSFAVLSAGTITGTKVTSKPFTNYCLLYPCGAVEFLKNHPEYNSLRMFNDYGWGGFMIGVWPEQRLFIDGRLPQYDFNNQTILEEYSQFFDKKQLENKLAEHQIKLVLFKVTEKPYQPDWFERYFLDRRPGERHNPLLVYLKQNNQWLNIYQDEMSIIYVKTN